MRGGASGGRAEGREKTDPRRSGRGPTRPDDGPSFSTPPPIPALRPPPLRVRDPARGPVSRDLGAYPFSRGEAEEEPLSSPGPGRPWRGPGEGRGGFVGLLSRCPSQAPAMPS